ncbi:alpha/beta fold hydrolase [Amycolatopsis sp. cg5]|uniref:alpha/beta fold hydrolase n=1 Tax=Amycolatopsis sp. cg5 TaxID=3238802 RepID=UPI003526BF39
MKTLLAVAIGLTMAVSAPAAEAKPDGLTVPKLDWRPCAQNPGFDCATATVPLDHDQPTGPVTHVALNRKAAPDQAHRIGSVFLNPGGPGGSGVAFAFDFADQLSASLQGKFDVVGFDPRGIGASDPLHCFAGQAESTAFLNAVPGFPYLREQERPFFDHYRSLGEKCRKNDATITKHMSTADVARDLDLLRRAVGDKKLTYLGFSYGSFLGNTYANLFPDNIRALVIDGVLDPALWSAGGQILSDRTNTALEFKEFLRLCDEAGAACPFATPQGSAARWEALAKKVHEHPVDLGDGETLTYDGLISTAGSAMYSPESWPDFAAVANFFANAALGDKPAASKSAAREADYDNGFDAYNGNVCADIRFPASFESYRAIGKFAEAGSRFGPFWWWGNAACADWPVNQDRYTGPWRTKTSAPVLVVGNYFDGVTSFAGAQASNRMLEGSRLLAYAGWGHTAYGRSSCVTAYVDHYLLNGALPAAGTVCPANPNPFLPSLKSAGPVAGKPPARR